MINPKCSMCDKELEKFGAIILSPPDGQIVSKFHICVGCYNAFIEHHLIIEEEWPDIDNDL